MASKWCKLKSYPGYNSASLQEEATSLILLFVAMLSSVCNPVSAQIQPYAHTCMHGPECMCVRVHMNIHFGGLKKKAFHVPKTFPVGVSGVLTALQMAQFENSGWMAAGAPLTWGLGSSVHLLQQREHTSHTFWSQHEALPKEDTGTAGYLGYCLYCTAFCLCSHRVDTNWIQEEKPQWTRFLFGLHSGLFCWLFYETLRTRALGNDRSDWFEVL